MTPTDYAEPSTTYPVTFTVVDDGNDYQDVELKGDMTAWANIDMSNDGTGTWTLTLDMEAGSYGWGALENDGSEWGIWLPSFAGFDSNPTVVVGPDGTISGDIGFTVPFQGGDEVTVTINVDMSNEDVSADGVHIAGTMNNWDPTASPMSDDDGDGVVDEDDSSVSGVVFVPVVEEVVQESAESSGGGGGGGYLNTGVISSFTVGTGPAAETGGSVIISWESSVNQAPVITSTAVTTATEGVLYQYTVTATDADTLTYSLTAAPTGMTINSASGLISWTPSFTQSGNHAVTVQVSDGNGGTVSQSFTIAVTNSVATISGCL